MPVANVNGININYRIEGEGEPLLLICGLGADMSMWKYQLSAFKKQHKLIMFDNRGAGGSDKPVGPYSMKQLADDAIALLDNLGVGKAAVLGYSLGGMIAQEVAINYPERVSKLILCSTMPCHDQESGLTAEATKLSGLSPFRYLRAILALAFKSRFWRTEQLIMRTLKSSKAARQGRVAQSAAIATFNSLDRLHLVKAPTLVVVGTDDRLIRPSSSEVLARRIPNAKLAKVEGGSHDMCIERSRAFNAEVLNFLAS
jgi:pimeloyl-ACP methyl ester carboxylesterase